MLWLDGVVVQGHAANFDLRDRGLLLGDGAFDTSLSINGDVILGDRHIARLASTCAALSIPMPSSRISELLQMAANKIGTGTLRLTVTRGAAPRGLAPPNSPAPCTLLSAQQGQPATIWKPVTAITSTTRRNETSLTARHKCLGYLDAVLAIASAAKTGADEALFLNSVGHVCCWTAGNIFVLDGAELKTPPLEDGVLDGIVRAELLTLAPQVGFAPVEGHLVLEDLANADAVFMTNSVRLIAPVLALDGVPLSGAGLNAVSRLAKGLSRRIEDNHGAEPWTNEGLSKWRVPS